MGTRVRMANSILNKQNTRRGIQMNFNRSLKVWWVIGLLVVVGLAFGGFPGRTAEEKKEPIKIGAAVSLTGRFERSGFLLFQGYKLAESLINKAGGIQGRPIELIIYDDWSNPDQAVKLYKKLLKEDGVMFLLGPYSSAVTQAVVPVAEDWKTPMVTAMAADPRIWEGQYNRWSVQMISSARLYLVGALEVAEEHRRFLGGDDIAIVYEDSSFPTAVAEGLRAKAKELGWEIVLDEAFSEDFTDWSTLAAKAKDAGAEVFAGGAYFAAAVGLTKAAHEVGYEPMLMSWTVGVTASDFVEAVGEDLAECVTGNSHWLPTVKTKGFLTGDKDITNEEFIQEFERLFGRKPDYHAAGGFGAVQLLAQAINSSMVVKKELWEDWKYYWEDIQKYVRDFLFKADTQTIFGRYNVVNEGEDAGLQIGKANFIVQWQKGPEGMAMEVIWPKDAATAEPCFWGGK